MSVASPRGLLKAIVWGLCITFLLLGALWHQSGLIDYVDVNLPSTVDATLVSLARFSASWDWYSNMGRPNASFLSEQVLLVPYLLLQLVSDSETASKLLLFGMVFAAYCGMVCALRILHVTWLAAASGATFAIVNPWFFDELAQGHIYLLMSAWAVPLAIVLFVQKQRWSTRDSVIGFFAIFYIVAIDFRFAALVYLAAIVGLLTQLFSRASGKEALWRSCALVAPPFALAFIVSSYVLMFSALRAGNAPSSSSLDYYSTFTSLWSALTLVRPNYNSIDQLRHLGDHLVYYWDFVYGVLLLLAARVIATHGYRALKATLGILAVTGVVLGSGLDSPFGGLNALLHNSVPLFGDLFRDPSKFYVLQVFAYAFLIGLSVNTIKPWPFQRLSEILDAPLRLVGSSVALPLVAAISVVLYLAPFLGWDFSTATSFDPKQNKNIVAAVNDAEDKARRAGARFAMFPPGVRVQYGGSSTFVYDPLALFPTAPDVRIPVAYDFEPSSMAARWSLGTVGGARTASPGSILDDLGVDEIAVRAVPAQYDLGSESGMLRALSAADFVNKSGLTSAGGGVFRTVGSGIAIGSNGSIVVDGDRETIVTARSLGIVPDKGTWCFATQCRLKDETRLLSDLTLAPDGDDLDVSQFGSADYGPHWIVGTIAWAEMNLSASRSATPSIVGFGRVTGNATVTTRARDVDVWVRAVNSGDAASYHLDGLDHPLRLDVPRTLVLGGFKWYRLGRVRLRDGPTSLTLRASGSHLCISNIRFTPPDAPIRRQNMYVGSLTDAFSWSSGHVFVTKADWSINGERVFFGGSSPARLDFQAAIPDGRWRFALHGRSDRRNAAVLLRSSSTCRLALKEVDSISQCDIQIRGGRFSIITTKGNVFADGIAFVDGTSGNLGNYVGQRLTFAHDNGSFTVKNPRRYRYVAVRIADPELWNSGSNRFGKAFGYAMLFDGSNADRIDGRLVADKNFLFGLAIAGITVLILAFGIFARHRSFHSANRERPVPITVP